MKKIIVGGLLGLIGAFGLFVVTIGFMTDKPRDVDKTKTVDNSGFHNGDIIFQTSRSSQSKAIQLATNSKYSHMGIIYELMGSFMFTKATRQGLSPSFHL